VQEFKNMTVFKKGTADSYESEAARRPITIKHILTHTAGITGNFLADEPAVTDLYLRNGIGFLGGGRKEKLGDVVKRLATLPLVSHPGEEWHYGDCLDIAGYLVEVVSGTSFREFLFNRVFKPLGMVDTDFFVTGNFVLCCALSVLWW
jgi:CubicO group peptidase (beta-lactamase class C family)